MRQLIPLNGSSIKNQAVQVNNQLTLNLYPRMEQDAKTEIALYHTPGLDSISSQSGDGRSNGVEWQGKLYFVIGSSLLSVETDDTVTSVGTLNTSTGRVHIAAGRSYLCIVDGTNGYSYNGSTFAVIADADFPDDATHVVYLDGFFLVNDAGTDDFYKSGLEDPTSWATLEFETASAKSDDIEAIGEYDRDFWAIGTYSTQRYYNAGNADFPFVPYPRNFELGILAPNSLIKTAYGLFWLANIPDGDAVIVQAAGDQYQIVSDPDTSSEMSRLTTKTDCISSVYTQEGHTFVIFTFPSDQLTKVYDVTQRKWHDRASYPLGKWRVSGLGYLSGRVIGIDFTDGNIYHVSRDVYQDNGSLIQRKRRSKILHNNRQTIVCYRYELEFDSGVADPSPECSFSYAWDGHTYGNALNGDMGGTGEYGNRTVFYSLGDGIELTTETLITGNHPVTIIGGYADIEERAF